jgi:hypothetical protein
MKPIISALAILTLSGCAHLDAVIGAPIRMHQSSIAADQAGLRFDAPDFGREVHARAILEAE